MGWIGRGNEAGKLGHLPHRTGAVACWKRKHIIWENIFFLFALLRGSLSFPSSSLPS